MSEFKNEVSPAAAKKIIETIKYKLWEYGFDKTQPAREMALGIAGAVKRITLEDVYKQSNKQGEDKQ